MRIMMLTVSENRENLMAALKAGAHGYVLKGVSASELRAITRRVASGEAYVTPALAADMLTEFSHPHPTRFVFRTDGARDQNPPTPRPGTHQPGNRRTHCALRKRPSSIT